MASKNIYYSFQKGKHGGSAGYIFPFFRRLNSLFPDQEYQDFVPAGYLKCQGQVLSARNYPELARIIGVGSNCIYRRDDVELDDPDPITGEGGQLQLPDLGSKYIVGASNPGIYENFETSNPSIDRSGIAVEIDSLGDDVDFFYQGDFKIPSRDLTVTGNIQVVGQQAATDIVSLQSGNFLGHAHNHTGNVDSRLRVSNQGVNKVTWRVSYVCGRNRRTECTADTNYGLTYAFVTFNDAGSESGTAHFHGGTLAQISGFSQGAIVPDTLVSSSPLVTNVRIRTTEVIKMDEFAPRYILCEYLIKV